MVQGFGSDPDHVALRWQPFFWNMDVEVWLVSVGLLVVVSYLTRFCYLALPGLSLHGHLLWMFALLLGIFPFFPYSRSLGVWEYSLVRSVVTEYPMIEASSLNGTYRAVWSIA